MDKLEENVKQIRKAGGEAVAIQCDVGNAESVASAFTKAEEKYGGVDFVFANAGVEGGMGTEALVDTSDTSLQSLFNTNVLGAVETLKYAVEAFERRGGGTIAFSSSVAAFCGEECRMWMDSHGIPSSSAIAYCASKSAIDMVAEGAHGAYHDKGVKVYNLNIGQFASEMGDRLGFKKNSAPFNPVFKDSLGDPNHIAEVLIALLDGTSKWPAGTAFVIDNDLTINSKYFYKKRKSSGAIEYLGWSSPEELKKVSMDVKGQPYKFKDEL